MCIRDSLNALVLAGQDDNGIILLNVHSFGPPLDDFGSQRQDLHVILLTQLTGHRSKDTGTLGVAVLLDDHGSVLIKADIDVYKRQDGG